MKDEDFPSVEDAEVAERAYLERRITRQRYLEILKFNDIYKEFLDIRRRKSHPTTF